MPACQCHCLLPWLLRASLLPWGDVILPDLLHRQGIVSSNRDSPGAKGVAFCISGLAPGLGPAPCPRGALSAGEARNRLRWADGKTIKNEVDLQVGARLLSQVLLWSPGGAMTGLGPASQSPGGPSAGNSLPQLGAGRVRGMMAGQDASRPWGTGSLFDS